MFALLRQALRCDVIVHFNTLHVVVVIECVSLLKRQWSKVGIDVFNRLKTALQNHGHASKERHKLAPYNQPENVGALAALAFRGIDTALTAMPIAAPPNH